MSEQDTLTKADEPSRENPSGPIGTRVIFENDLVRIWDMQVAPHGKKVWHHHTLPYAIVPITGGKVEIENTEGKVYQGEEGPGEAIWRDAGEKHELRNLTDCPYQNILVGVKVKR
jgi:quercetin dioxygenase-like cupin family protein